MGLSKEEFLELENKARELRKLVVDTVVWAGSGHVGGSLSSTDVLTVLYYKYLNIDPKNPEWDDRDRFILSKGHIGVGYAPVLADKGYFPKEMLKTYNHTHSKLGMHLDKNKVVGVDASSGSLGHGLPIALGLGLGAKLQKKDYKIYCLLGDGESDEGSVWEAAMGIANYNATNVITFVDRNMCMIDGPTEEVMKLEPFADKWKAFGFNVLEIDGHDIYAIADAIDKAHAEKNKPTVIILKTIKACGIEYMAGDYRYHYAGFDSEKAQEAKDSIDKYHDERLNSRK